MTPRVGETWKFVHMDKLEDEDEFWIEYFVFLDKDRTLHQVFLFDILKREAYWVGWDPEERKDHFGWHRVT